MRVLVRSSGPFSNSILLLALLQWVLVSNFSIMISAAAIHRVDDVAELEGSLARYRPLIEHGNTRYRVLQVRGKKKLEEQGDRELDSKQPDKHVDELQAEQKVVVRADANVEGFERSENSDLRQQQGNLEKVVESESKIEELHQQQEEQKVVEPDLKTEERHQQERQDIMIPASKTEELQQQGEEHMVVEPERKTEELQQQGDEHKLVEPERKTEELQQQGEEHKIVEPDSKIGGQQVEEEPFNFPEPYLLGPTIKDWDEQRGGWLEANPHMKLTPDGKPRVLIVTGSQPGPCLSPVGDNFHIKSLKVKIDYARMHNYEIFYSLAHLDPLFNKFWVKLPILRKLMLTHPEIEWFFWIDSDAVFTDMLFEAPFHTYEGFNMVMWGWEEGVYKNKSWLASNAGVFLLRNCQWSLDLIDKWSPMGPEGPVRVQFGKMFTAFLASRSDDFPADDQSALAYLMITDESVRAKVKLVDSSSYVFSGFWLDVVETYENSMEKYHPGLGDKRWPWITHFSGCGPCAGGDNPAYSYEKCMDWFSRAFNFADNQVLAYMGYQHKSLSSSEVIRIKNGTDRPSQFFGVNPWEERIAQVAAAGAEGRSS